MKQKRNIIEINEELCNGCGRCVKGCHEGALQLIGGKAKLVSELYCDGLGACIGDCPVNAITVEEREVEPYDENAVMERLVPQGRDVVVAHLRHLKAHGEQKLYQTGIQYLKDHGIDMDVAEATVCECPGLAQREFGTGRHGRTGEVSLSSSLSHWPIQLHLQNPQASYFEDADVILAADCTGFTLPAFNPNMLKDFKLSIACPKLDTNKESYIDKIVQWVDVAGIRSITVVMMEVPCCGGLLMIVKRALEQCSRKIPVKKVVVGLRGDVLQEESVNID